MIRDFRDPAPGSPRPEARAAIYEAIARVNDSIFGLQTGVFTNDLAGAWKAFAELEVGGVIVNDVPTYRIDHMPYGGVKILSDHGERTIVAHWRMAPNLI